MPYTLRSAAAPTARENAARLRRGRVVEVIKDFRGDTFRAVYAAKSFFKHLSFHLPNPSLTTLASWEPCFGVGSADPD
jgi:hypothetical protein